MAPTASRAAAATAAGVAGAVLLAKGHAPWPAAVLGGAGAAVFVVWRAIPGVWTAFGLLLAASLAAWTAGVLGAYRVPRALWLWCAALETYGIATILAVRAAREPVQLSRRLLGAWLASTGALGLGLALTRGDATAPVAGALVAFALLYRLGVVPAYAWAPMLIRHPAPRFVAAGVAGIVLAYAALRDVVPRLPDRADAGMTVIVLSAVTLPWSLWQASRQWRRDRRCARTYGVVALMAASLLWQLTRVLD